jgi:two-component system, OmpR family, alkaline phosphatase synthesis response regulator PhoP
MRNVLLIGDIESLTPYADALKEEGFFPFLRSPGSEGEPQEEYDVAVIDLPSVGEDWTAASLIDAAGSDDSVPVIVVAGPDQLAAFDPIRDVDDYVRSRSAPDELVMRVRRALWKKHRVDSRNVLKCGDLVMDLGNYTVQVAGHSIDLTYKEYELLRFLATNRDRVYSREVLLNKVWGYDFYGGARTVDVHVRRLRSKIEDRHHTFIETVRNVGYRFRAMP